MLRNLFHCQQYQSRKKRKMNCNWWGDRGRSSEGLSNGVFNVRHSMQRINRFATMTENLNDGIQCSKWPARKQIQVRGGKEGGGAEGRSRNASEKFFFLSHVHFENFRVASQGRRISERGSRIAECISRKTLLLQCRPLFDFRPLLGKPQWDELQPTYGGANFIYFHS